MDVAGALLPFTQVVRPELTIHVQEVLIQADNLDSHKQRIPEIKEPEDANPTRHRDNPAKSNNSPTKSNNSPIKSNNSPVQSKNSALKVNTEVKVRHENPAWWLTVVVPARDTKHVTFETKAEIHYIWMVDI